MNYAELLVELQQLRGALINQAQSRRGGAAREPRSEQALAEARDHYFHLYDEAPIAYAILDRNGLIEEINIAGALMLGTTKRLLHRKPLLVFLHPTSRRQFLDHMHRCRHSEEPVSTEVVVENRRGKLISILMTSTAHDGRSRPTTFRTAMLDLSEKKKTDELLLRAQRLVSLGTFAAGIAHEINNPLNTMLLMAKVAMSRLQNHAERDQEVEMLHLIVQETQRCAEIVRNLLRFAKHEKTEKKPLDLNEVLNNAVRLAQISDPRCDVSLRPCEGSVFIQGNSTELEQVLLNLIKNAMDAQPEGCKIGISCEVAGEEVRLSVYDNGPGISEEQAKHIFDPFYTTKRGQGGTGLGLSIVHAIIEGHGGVIEVESQLQRGARFIMKFPLADPREPNDESAHS